MATQAFPRRAGVPITRPVMDHGTETIGETPTDTGHPEKGSAGRPWQNLLAAVSLLTVLPVGTSAEPRSGGGFVRGATAFFPAVGAGIGGLGALVLLGADALGLGMAIAAIAAIGVTVAVAGALHEDGLADFADGAGGGWTRGERLRIMRDSRIGSYGVLAVLFSVGLRIAALASLASVIDAAFAMVVAAAASRAAMPATTISGSVVPRPVSRPTAYSEIPAIRARSTPLVRSRGPTTRLRT